MPRPVLDCRGRDDGSTSIAQGRMLVALERDHRSPRRKRWKGGRLLPQVPTSRPQNSSFAPLFSNSFSRLTQVPEQPSHYAEAFPCDRCKQVFIRSVLRTAGVGVRNPNGLELEHIDKDVVGQ